jgi:hypothetical protein
MGWGNYKKALNGETQRPKVRVSLPMDPDEVSYGPVETLKEMSAEKQAEMVRLYGKGPKKKF